MTDSFDVVGRRLKRALYADARTIDDVGEVLPSHSEETGHAR